MNLFDKNYHEHVNLFHQLETIKPSIIESGQLMVRAIQKNNKLLICGNGGSAADSQHFAAELIGRFESERQSLGAIALTTDSSIVTALANDYGYDDIFRRQVEGLAVPGDILIGISTSGNSPNVIHAMEYARKINIKTVGLLGKDGGALKPLSDIAVTVPNDVTARIQEMHIFIIHFWCGLIETEACGNGRLGHVS